MKQLSVIILAPDDEQRTILQMQADATAVARTIQAFSSFPVGSTDLIVRRVQEVGAEVAILDVPREGSASALRAIELLHATVPAMAIFAVGETSQPQVIINAMRSGAREFLERPTSTTGLLEAFVRLTASQRKNNVISKTGKVFTFLNAKGGAGCTTLSVNTAMALQNLYGNVALVDLAPIGHTALHLNQKPAFSILDAMHNIHRLDASLLEVYMTRCPNGLHLLAGSTEPMPDNITSADYAQLFDAIVAQYAYVVVDASSRLDTAVRVVSDLSHKVIIVGLTDVASIWSTAKVQAYLGISSANLHLVLNRFRKISGLSDAEIEAATHTKVLWKVPNHFAAISSGIDRGVPAVQQNHTEVARSFMGLAALLSERERPDSKRRTFSLFGADTHA